MLDLFAKQQIYRCLPNITKKNPTLALSKSGGERGAGIRLRYPAVVLAAKAAASPADRCTRCAAAASATGSAAARGIWGVRGPYGRSPAALWILSGRTESIAPRRFFFINRGNGFPRLLRPPGDDRPKN